MTNTTQVLLERYVDELQQIYGAHLRRVLLYGSYARGDYKTDSDIDIMILLDLPETDIKQYRHDLSGVTFDYNIEFDLEIKPIAKNEEHFEKWKKEYPFYAKVEKEGVKLFEAA